MRKGHGDRWRSQRWPARLTLWLATVLFALQVGLHAAMPTHMTTPQMLDTVLGGAEAAHGPAMDGMAMPATPDPVSPAHAGHADTLCCMPPLAPAPQFWVPPLLPPAVRLRVAVRTVTEALRVLRATARGPPRGMPVTFSLI